MCHQSTGIWQHKSYLQVDFYTLRVVSFNFLKVSWFIRLIKGLCHSDSGGNTPQLLTDSDRKCCCLWPSTSSSEALCGSKSSFVPASNLSTWLIFKAGRLGGGGACTEVCHFTEGTHQMDLRHIWILPKSLKKFMLPYLRHYAGPLKSSPFHHLQSQLRS